MIKQITVSNLFNFKEEFTVDFTNSGKDESYSHEYNSDSIGNISLIYGKNNVGKSNFIKIIKESFHFILNNKTNLEYSKFSKPEDSSMFEIIFENENNEIRYGFEINIENAVVIDEWFFSKIDGSSRESNIFSRLDNKYSSRFKASEVKMIKELNSEILIIHHLQNLNKNLDLVKQLIESIKEVTFVSSLIDKENDVLTLIPQLFKVSESLDYEKIVNQFLRSADLDINKILITRLSDEVSDFLEQNDTIMKLQISEEEKKEKIRLLIENNKDIIPELINRNFIGNFDENNKKYNFSVEFLHKKGVPFQFNNLSSGTKQIINIIMNVTDKIATSSVLFFDEIEMGLHIDLVDLVMNFFKLLIEVSPEIQFIITTHQKEILDYDFISNENKIFFNYDNNLDRLEIDYLSNYKLREYHVPSKRYVLDAFNNNPNTTKKYNLNQTVREIYSNASVKKKN